MENPRIQKISELLMQTGLVHHKAFNSTDGADSEWPLWNSAQLKGASSTLLGSEMTRSRIIYELVRLEETADTSKDHRTKVYATDLSEKLR